LVRIWRCYGSQILAVEWQGAGKRLSDAGESSPGSGQEIQYEVYLFHLADRRDVMADCLRAYAASKDVKGEGPPVLTDPSFRNIVIGQTKEEQMLAATVTTLGPTPRVGLFAAEQKADHRPRLFVLTKASVLEFAINSSSWHPPSELDPAIFDDFLPDDLNEVEGEGEELEAEEVFPPPSDEEMALRHLDRLSAASGKVRPPPQTGPGRPVLTLAKTYKLPASEIHFESRSEADLTLHFSSGAFCIRFFTDSSREVWRRGLAYTLIRGEKGWERQR